MTYATISDISRRWRVDRATARIALRRADVHPCEVFASPRYSWDEILRKVEAWPATTLCRINHDDYLATAEDLADRLGVTTQTIRNYGRTGRLHRVEITPRAIRYLPPHIAKTDGEGKSDDVSQK